MNLPPQTADKIARAYGRLLDEAIGDLLCKHGLAILTDDARRELILNLGAERRQGNRLNARNRAKFAAMRAATEQAPTLSLAAE